MALPNGTALLSIGENKAPVVEINGYAATVLGSEGGAWRVRVNPQNPEQFSLSYKSDDSKTLTLSMNPGELLIVTTPMGNPTPPAQLWTMEECIGPKIFPPMMQGRLQSCQDPKLSVVIGGGAPLPRTHMALSAVPNEVAQDNRETSLWYVRYQELSQDE